MPKLIDLTGQRFGRLVVLRRAEENIRNRPAWVCQCDCGNIKIAAGNLLRRGDTTSCGCYNKERISQTQRNDIQPGMRFGHWTVLSENKERRCSYITYKCKCDCGTIKDIIGSSLIHGQSNSCGKCLRNDIIGKTYGLLTILSIDKDKTTDKNLYVKCRCSCGTIKSYEYTNLKHGGTKSCGCLKQSYGEYIINKILLENNIPFKRQATFDDCRFKDTNHLAQFDFYVNNNYIIEFDGKQHFYKSCEFFKNGFEYTRNHDLFKNKYCFDHKIPIIRIPYTYENNISIKDLLLDTSNFILEGDDYYFKIEKEIPIL